MNPEIIFEGTAEEAIAESRRLKQRGVPHICGLDFGTKPAGIITRRRPLPDKTDGEQT